MLLQSKPVTELLNVIWHGKVFRVKATQLLVPRHNLSTYGRRAFSVVGSAAWNCLSDELREPLLTANSFRQLLKTRLFAKY